MTRKEKQVPEKSINSRNSPAPKELLALCDLELKERRLLKELIAVRLEKDELQHQILARRIEVPWLKNKFAKNPVSTGLRVTRKSTT